MAITRTPIVDDDGTGTTGTVIDNAWKQEFYNQIDAASGTYGTFTPIDASGAGLTFTGEGGSYVVIGKLVVMWIHVIFPATASGATALIAGLPLANGPKTAGFYQTYGPSQVWYLGASGTAINIFAPNTMAGRTNAEMSGSNNVLAGVYLTA